MNEINNVPITEETLTGVFHSNLWFYVVRVGDSLLLTLDNPTKFTQ